MKKTKKVGSKKVKRIEDVPTEVNLETKSSFKKDPLKTIHKAELTNGIVVVTPDSSSLPSSDPRNELATSYKGEQLTLKSTGGIIVVQKVYDNEIQHVIDSETQYSSHIQSQEVHAKNLEEKNNASANLKQENYNGAIVIESESYKDLIEILNYQDSGKIKK